MDAEIIWDDNIDLEFWTDLQIQACIEAIESHSCESMQEYHEAIDKRNRLHKEIQRRRNEE